jgi:hypothetical protein
MLEAAELVAPQLHLVIEPAPPVAHVVDRVAGWERVAAAGAQPRVRVVWEHV